MARTARRALVFAPFVAAAAVAVAATALLAAAAAAGVFARAPGAWTVRWQPLPAASRLAIELNVAGLLRLATSPLGRRLLDGRSADTRGGRLRFRRHAATLVVECDPCTLHDTRLASRAIELPIGVRLTPRLQAAAAGRIDGWLTAPGLEIAFEATLGASGVDVAWNVGPTELTALVRLLAAAIPEAHVARVAGTVSARGSLHLPSRALHGAFSFADLAVDGLGTEALAAGLFEQDCPAPDGTPRRRLNGEGSRFWLPLEDLGPRLPAAVLAAAEEARPFERSDPTAQRGTASHMPGERAIAQRLARTLFVGAGRDAASELRALLYAVEMQRTLGRARILELHLNTAHWGPGICGARTAARVYFGKAPAQLTALQAAWLAASLGDPQRAFEREFLRGTAQLEGAKRVLVRMRELPAAEGASASPARLGFAPPPRGRVPHATPDRAP